ncbi:hypothetical protein LT493_44045 [Streptomyces tricolor]|nr:hypothetical protein [Streptomyces tricolor]
MVRGRGGAGAVLDRRVPGRRLLVIGMARPRGPLSWLHRRRCTGSCRPGPSARSWSWPALKLLPREARILRRSDPVARPTGRRRGPVTGGGPSVGPGGRRGRARPATGVRGGLFRGTAAGPPRTPLSPAQSPVGRRA